MIIESQRCNWFLADELCTLNTYFNILIDSPTSCSLGTHLSSLQLIPCWRSLRFKNMQCISAQCTLLDCNHFSLFQLICNRFLADELCTWKILFKIYYLTSCEPHCSALVTYSFQLIHWRALCPEHISAHERRGTYQRSRMQSLNALQILLLGW